jgi:D-tyrosyl-tRNA(Tyr) deacylase
MKAVVQRVSRADVTIDGAVVGQVQKGLMILLGVAANDTEEHARIMAQKLTKLRIFTDENGKMNRSLLDIAGGALVVSNFTLLADTSHGNRPSFTGAGDPEKAKKLYEYFLTLLPQLGVPTQSGQFGADMLLHIENDGPVTILLDSNDWIR